MRKMMGWLIALLMMCGSAVAEQAALPWSMTWETTPAGCVQALEANMGEGCTIVALRDGSVQIDLTARQGEYGVSFRAVFDGGRTREQIDSVTLNELADEALRLSWVAIDFAPAGEEQSSDWGAAMEMYRTVYDRFVQEFGEQAIKRVYLSAPHSGGRISHRSERGPDGLPDWEALRRDWNMDSETCDALWLIAGDDHASCRLYATFGEAGTGNGWLWRASCYFTRERQAAAFEQYKAGGIGAMEAAAIGRQAALEDTGMTEADFIAYYRDPDVWQYDGLDRYVLYVFARSADKHDGDSRVCQIGIDPYTGAVLSLEWTDGVG